MVYEESCVKSFIWCISSVHNHSEQQYAENKSKDTDINNNSKILNESIFLALSNPNSKIKNFHFFKQNICEL